MTTRILRGRGLRVAPPTPTVRGILAAGGMLALLRQRLDPPPA